MRRPFSSVLVANRGEIAVRILRTARALGYRTVAVHSEADRHSPHVRVADKAVAIGAAAPAASYLAVDKIVGAALRAGADAVHPGYGFLSESPALAEACAAAGLVFVGPPAEVIRLMGNKAAAKRRMQQAGIPCLPGYDGAKQDDRTLLEEAERIGYPLMIKAAAGGGGKGMRLVRTARQLPDALRGARSEAQKAFGSDEIILERAVGEPRHVEVQVFADAHGNVVHLWERDCSIQRRHQKLIEEAPAPSLPDGLRRDLCETAVAVARSIGYVGAGTVEFLLDEERRFHFLEMNTRLQVEHGVTECVTGLDLVAMQLKVAAGEPLPVAQRDVEVRGHAIEARLCAEAPHADFTPRSGTLLAWEPAAGPGVRVDHGLAAGLAVTPYYDPLLAKVIAHGADREEARRRLSSALLDTVALGLETNRLFLVDCLAHPSFVEGGAGTGFVDRHLPPEARRPPDPDDRTRAVAAALLFENARCAGSELVAGWSSAGPGASPLLLRCGDASHRVEVSRLAPGRFRVLSDAGAHEVELAEIGPHHVRFTADSVEETGRLAWEGGALHLEIGRASGVFEDALHAERVRPQAREREGAALAPMTGVVVAVPVKEGDSVSRGQILVVLEAMKMEHEITAPFDGTVRAVFASPGEHVAHRKLLVEIETGAPSR